MTLNDSLYESAAAVVVSELRSAKPSALVYERKATLFFLSDRESALRDAEAELEKLKADEQKGQPRPREEERRSDTSK